MMLVFAGFVAGVLVWLPVGWLMKRDSYTRHYVPVPMPAPDPMPVAALAAPAPEVHVHLTMPAAAPAPMVVQPARWEIER